METSRIENMKKRTHAFIDAAFDGTEKAIKNVREKGQHSVEKSEEILDKLREEAKHLKKEVGETFDDLKDRIPKPSDFATVEEFHKLEKRVVKLEKRIAQSEAEMHGETKEF